MSTIILSRLFEHNDWANARMIDACAALDDSQLDATPLAGSDWSVRSALTHLVEAQQAYVSLLTQPPTERDDSPLAFGDLGDVAATSGEALRELALQPPGTAERLRSLDGYHVDPWVVLVQAINHATDHRRQLRGLLQAQGLTPPDVDGWNYGEHTGAIEPVAGE